MSGYTWNANEFAELLIRKSYPERTDSESALLRDYLLEHLGEFDRIEFSVRVGTPITPDPTHLEGVQRQALLNSLKRIDMVGYSGQQATLVEAKTVVSHAVMGQLLMDRQLWMQQFPDAPEPRLVAIGRRGTAQDAGVLNAHGIDVYLYEAAAT